MARRLKLKGAESGVTVELPTGKDGETAVFSMVPITMSVEEELDECAREIERVEENTDSSPLDRTSAIAAQLDVLLSREGAPENGKPTKPTEILLPAYEAGEVTGMAIRKLVGDMVAEARPT